MIFGLDLACFGSVCLGRSTSMYGSRPGMFLMRGCIASLSVSMQSFRVQGSSNAGFNVLSSVGTDERVRSVLADEAPLRNMKG